VCTAVFHIYLISAAVILLVSLASVVKFSLPYNKAGRAGVLCNFIMFSLKFCVVWYFVYNDSYFQIVIQFVISVHFFS
jgi:hypothetical protein